MCRLLPLFLFLLFTFSFSKTGSTGIPPNESRTLGTYIPDIVLVNSEGSEFNLYSLKGKPIIINFIYTKCKSACPIMTESLKKVISEDTLRDFHVISFSFDPKDKVKDLRKFKEEHSLPESWIVATAKDKEELFKLLDAVDFRFVTLEDGEFIHPNIVVFLDKDMKIVKYIYGVTYNSIDFKNAMRIAKGELALPEKFRGHMFLIGMLGFVGTLLSTIIYITKRRYNKNIK